MKPITTSVYTFKDFIGGGFLYIDKTAAVRELIRPAKSQVFLSRPRRFGKSLLVSTLKAVFQGRRDLFDGLALGEADYDWPVHPVIHLDLGSAAADTAEGLSEHLLYALDRNAKEYGLTLSRPTAPGRFLELVQSLSDRQGPVVVLVDEYDKPLLGHLGNPSVKPIQNLLKQFYSVIKTTEALQRFALLTGVSKFAKVSVFSDLNNLTDLTMDPRAATLLGYTQEELEAGFPDYIARLADTLGKTVDDTLEELRVWYNGYRFEPTAPTVYNPVSVMKCFDTQRIKNYWFETGTPTFLVNLLRENPVDLSDLQAPETTFSTYDPLNLAPMPLLVQTGYLTLKGAEQLGDMVYYRLGYPNFEIEHSFNYWLAHDFSRAREPEMSGALLRMIRALQGGRIDEMLDTLRIFFANIPYDLSVSREKYYQTIFYTVFKLIGASIEAEVSTNIGRIDAVVKTEAGIFVFEFKLNGTAEAALAQIREKRYFEPYLGEGRPVTLIGVEFSAETRNLGEHRMDTLPPGTAPSAVREPEPAYSAPNPPDVHEIARRLRAIGLDPASIEEITGVVAPAADSQYQ